MAYKLIFDVSTPTGEYKMFRVFETESENLAYDEALQMEWELCHIDAKVLFEKVEVIDSVKLSVGEKHESVNQ